MAHRGYGFFDNKGAFHKAPDEATVSDLSSILGKIGDGESLAPGIAYMLLDRRADIERCFAEHDSMMAEYLAADKGKVTRLKTGGSTHSEI